jgi:hypothetical protein
VVTACLGAATPRPPVPLLSNPAALLTAARRLALLVPLFAAALGAGGARAADGGEGWAARPGLPTGAPVLDTALGLPAVVYPIEVPPGRRGMAPAIALQYSSAMGHGPAGSGFGIVMGSIERSTRLGPPRFDNTHTFVLAVDGQALDLLPIDGASGRHLAYGLGGISTQQFARDLSAAGYSGSLFTLTGRGSDFLIEMLYGPYGGGLAFGAGMAASGDRASGAGP